MDIFEAIERGLAPPGNGGAAPPDGGAPSEEQMNKILEAARWAASAYNTQPWHFQVLRRARLPTRGGPGLLRRS